MKAADWGGKEETKSEEGVSLFGDRVGNLKDRMDSEVYSYDT